MAFSNETKRLKITEILGITTLQLGVKLDAYAEHLTAAVETRVDAQITRWESGIGEDFDTIEARGENFGLNTNPESERDDVREKIMKHLFFTAAEIAELNGGSGFSDDSFTIERG